MSEGWVCMGTNKRSKMDSITDGEDGGEDDDEGAGKRRRCLAQSSLVTRAQMGSKPLLND